MTTAQGPEVARPLTHARFSRFAWGVLAYNVVVVLWGALVRATGSGAGCGGHWPLCNGDVIPQAPTLATVIEYTHRLMSGAAIASVLALWIWSRREFPSGRTRRLAGWSLVFLIVEALLGAGLVLFNYVALNASVGRAFYLALHLANTQVLLGVLTLTAFTATREEAPPRLRKAPGLVLAALPTTIALSMTGAVAALGDTLFPATSFSAGFGQDFATAAHVLLRLRLFHPPLAVVAGLYVLYTASSVVRLRPSRPVKRWAAALAGLVLLQLCAGAVNIALLAPVWLQIVHLLLADLMWIALVILTAHAAVTAAGAPTQVAAVRR